MKCILAIKRFNLRAMIKISAIALALLFALFPFPVSFIERFYTNGFYSRLQSVITPATNLLPFAFGDLLIIALIILIPAWWALRIKKARGKRWREMGRLAFNTLTLAAIIFLGFLFLWGFNYQRQPLAARLDYDNQRLTEEALKQFKRLAVERVDVEYAQARTVEWPDETTWRGELHQSFGETIALLGQARNIAAARPKTSLFDFYFGSAGIAGMVNPFGLEVILDGETLFFEKPFTLAHEWAHLAGYANESEASFVGAIACIRSRSAALRYSGWLALYQHAPWPDENDKPPRPSDAVIADIRAISERVNRRLSATISSAQWKMYDRFLKANRVREGTLSYGLLVDLLVGTRFEDGWVPALRK
ncbi:MAG: DUF3810 family protein [Acidobacteriota bacterium]